MYLPPSGGHLDVVRLLVDQASDVDSQDNRKVSCLMAAFRKVHIARSRSHCVHVQHVLLYTFTCVSCMCDDMEKHTIIT